ncbi:class F sortase [Nocardioides sp. R-C-SC26]|uniref:class F sortase n=1 Tax=Nocardioides sp. R-C-SC26 TaxID=2870414 RepID=UPI001E4B1A27|nr:class F sortase [Nocardioides sp. R-C-SC26]
MTSHQSESTPQRPGRAAILVAVLALVVAVVALGVAVTRPHQTPVPPTVGGKLQLDDPQQPVQGGPFASDGDNQLVIPSIGVEAPMLNIAVDADGVLTPPSDVNDVGWWIGSAKPGKSKTGQTLITGHTVHAGEGVLNDLPAVKKGAWVGVRFDDKVQPYRVTDIQTLTREEVADQRYELFGQEREDGRLVLVSCTDWVDGQYLSNTIVFAERIKGAVSA